MNLHFSKKNDGSAMLVVALIALIVAGILSAYLLLVSHESTMVQRSENWNSAINVAEAGVEEGMALINTYAGAPNGGISAWTNSAAANRWDTTNEAAYRSMTWTYNGVTTNWATTNGTIYHMARWLDPTVGYYNVYVNNSSSNGPEILSIGVAKWAATGASPLSDAIRKIYVQAYGSTQLGDNGLVGDQLNFNGNNVTIDSFDSSSPLHSIWQTNLWFHGTNYGTWSSSLSYNPSVTPNRTANVHVASESGLVDVGNANIYGYINTTPGGSYTIKRNGVVGDLNWFWNGNSGLQKNPPHFKDDLNHTHISYSLPTTFSNAYQYNNWLPVPTGAAGTTNIVRIGGIWTNNAGTWINTGGFFYTNKNNSGWAITSGGNTVTYFAIITNRPPDTNSPSIYYAMNSIGSGNLFVDAPYTVLYLTNSNTSMNSPILTINTNADLTIYSAGNITFGTTVNNTALARALTINDISGHPISVSAFGNASGVAKLYIPSSSITLNGGGNNTYDIIGEITCYSASFNGHFNLHFDESLETNTASTQYVSILWKEVQ